MSQKVKKAIIPAAGLGTRFLPATKTVPKEMLTLVDAPVILYVVEEAVKAGIEDIVLIAGRGKHAIEDFFDISYEVEDKLAKDGKLHLLDRLIKLRDQANIISIRQKQPLGLGHAVLCSEPIIGKNPFAVLLGDEITVEKGAHPNTTTTLCQLYEQSNCSTVAVMEVERSQIPRYGIADVQKIREGYFKVLGLVEKPSIEKAPSNWALPGRYVFHDDIFGYLKNTKAGLNGEIQLTDSMHQLAQEKDMYAATSQSLRFDAGDKLGFLKANIELALRNSELKDDLKNYLKDLVPNL